MSVPYGRRAVVIHPTYQTNIHSGGTPNKTDPPRLYKIILRWDEMTDRWRLHGVPDMDDRTATFALTLPGHRPQELARSLAAQGIAVGAGGFHATGIIDALGLPTGRSESA